MKVLLVAGHGRRYNGPTKSWIDDPGAVGNGTTERDFTRKTIVPAVAKYLKQAGHSVFLYGGTTMNQDMFGDTLYGNYIGNNKDYGLYWVKGEKYDVVIEFHLDAAGASATGGHVIIPTGLNADSIDKGIQKALETTVGTIRGISPRSDLLNCNVAKQLGINYRLVELGFITSKKDMDYLKANTDSFCKKIAEAINGKAIGTVQKKPVKKVVKKTVTAKPKPKAAPKKYQTYKVKKGDSLWKISQEFNVPVDTLVKLNAIKNNAIFIDQVIRIKEVSGTVKQKKPAAQPNLRTKKEMLERIKWYKGQSINFDNCYGLQCADVSTDYIWYMSKGTCRAWGNARDLINNKFPAGWKMYANTAEFVPEVGDIAVYTKDWFDNAYGHVALVYADPTPQTMIVIEQNWDGKANTPCATRKDNYYGVSHFIRPAYQ